VGETLLMDALDRSLNLGKQASGSVILDVAALSFYGK
jgi:hypothetical protein